MKAEILMIGTELLLGQIEDTNATFMARTLADSGIDLYQKTTVGDNTDRIVGALRAALERSDVVLCSGGLGPTEDDITRECVAQVLDRPLEYHADLFELIEQMFARYRLRVTENNKRQAMVPRGAMVVENPNGTAPGLIVDDSKGIVVCMPGVPRELYPMLTERVIPWLRDRFRLNEVLHYRVLKVCGIGESHVDHLIGDLILNGKNPTVGVLANPGAVRIRIAAKAKSRAEAESLIDSVDEEVRRRLPNLIMGVNDDTIEGVVNRLLAERDWTLGVVETASGGAIAQRMIAVGATQFTGARILRMESLDLENASKTARQLADSAREEFNATCGLAVISDPAAGATIVAFVHPAGAEEWVVGRAGTSDTMQSRIATTSLEFVRRFLIGVPVQVGRT
jgi:nicotinamide-nucleotide amidase